MFVKERNDEGKTSRLVISEVLVIPFPVSYLLLFPQLESTMAGTPPEIRTRRIGSERLPTIVNLSHLPRLSGSMPPTTGIGKSTTEAVTPIRWIPIPLHLIQSI